MPEVAIGVPKKREESKANRDPLFACFLKNPRDTRLALEIKTIADQVAENVEQRKRKKEQRN